MIGEGIAWLTGNKEKVWTYGKSKATMGPTVLY